MSTGYADLSAAKAAAEQYERELRARALRTKANYDIQISEQAIEECAAWSRFINQVIPGLATDSELRNKSETIRLIKRLHAVYCRKHPRLEQAEKEIDEANWSIIRIDNLREAEKRMKDHPDEPYYAKYYHWLLTGEEPEKWDWPK